MLAPRYSLRRQFSMTSRTDAQEEHPERAWQTGPSK
jgi:hypothetical protein